MFEEPKLKLNENKYSTHAPSNLLINHHPTTTTAPAIFSVVTFLNLKGKILRSFDKVKYFHAMLLAAFWPRYHIRCNFLTSHFLYFGPAYFFHFVVANNWETEWHSFTRRVNCRKRIVVLFNEAKDPWNFSLYAIVQSCSRTLICSTTSLKASFHLAFTNNICCFASLQFTT